MFYKLMNGNVVMDLLNEVRYVRYLPKAKRWITTESSSAHGICGSNGNDVFLLEGRNCACEDEKIHVRLVSISEEEFIRLSNEAGMRQQERQDLVNRINSLEESLNKQTALLEQLLSKLS